MAESAVPLKLLSVGVSVTEFCGIQQYESVLNEALRRNGVEVVTEWWWREESWSHRRVMREGINWARALGRRARDGHDCVLWHYSAFMYGPAGVPLLAPVIARRLGASGVPLMVLMHEFALPWGRGGVRGAVQSATQRLAMFCLARDASALIVTTEQRKARLKLIPIVNSRPIEALPIFSTLPAAGTGSERFAKGPADGSLSIGIFGYGAGEYLVDVVTGAIALLIHEYPQLKLRLVGSPGPAAEPLRCWQQSATRAGCASAVEATGPLDPVSLMRELSRCDIMVLPDPAGPTSRKTTLAAMLAAGCPVVALDGPQRWHDLVRSGAAIVACPDPHALATVLRSLLDGGDARGTQGARALAFYNRELAPDEIARRLRIFAQGLAQARLGSVEDPHIGGISCEP